jgi:hypothetical protein
MLATMLSVDLSEDQGSPRMRKDHADVGLRGASTAREY